MTPALRLALSLVLSLLLWVPTIPGALAAHEDPARIAGRYLLALILSRFGVGIVFRVINAYVTQNAVVDEPDDAAAADEPTDDEMLFGRRREDPLTSPSTEELLDDALADVSETASMVP